LSFSEAAMTNIFLTLLLLAPGPAKPDREQIESIELNAAGTAGVIRTRPEFMRDGDAVYHFGEGACKAHKLGDRTLEQLSLALRNRHFVEIAAEERGDQHCVARVTFFAPDP
jgi:hypothetical protein